MCKLQGQRKHPSVSSAANDTCHKAKTGNVQLKMWDITCTLTILSDLQTQDDNLHINTTNCPGTVKTNLKGMPMDFGKTTLKWGEINARFRGDLTATVWKDKL